MQVKKGTFTLDTVTGQKVITGVGFTPDLVLLMGVRVSSVGVAGSYAASMGAMAGDGTQGAVGWSGDDNVNPSNTARGMSSTRCLYIMDGNGTNNLVMAYVSMDADGFTVNVDSTAVANSILIEYIALGDLPNVTVKTNAVTTVASGSQSFTNFGFQPDALIFLSGWNSVDRKSVV